MKKIGSFKSVSNPSQVLWDDERACLIVISTVGDFAVFDYDNLEEPVWRFKLKKINNANDFELVNRKLYGTATSGTGDKYFTIDLETRIITNCLKDDIEPDIYSKIREIRRKRISFYGSMSGIPEEFRSVQYVSCYYENDKFKFVGSWNNLMIIPKEQTEAKTLDTTTEPTEDSENYIRKNGITKYVLENYGEEEIIHGGFFWALDRKDEKSKTGNREPTETESILFSIGLLVAEIDNGGFEQYLGNGSPHNFENLIKNLKLIGATKTAKTIEKAIKIQTDFDGHENHNDAEYEKLSEKISELEGELDADDYVGLAVKYLKRKHEQ